MSDTENFAEYVARERERLMEDRDRLLRERSVIDAYLAAIDREFAAVTAYEAAKTGKTTQPVKNGAVQRASRGSRRDEILGALAESDKSRSDLLKALGVKGNKSGEMSVSNALTNMMKAGQIGRENGVYFRLREAA